MNLIFTNHSGRFVYNRDKNSSDSSALAQICASFFIIFMSVEAERKAL